MSPIKMDKIESALRISVDLISALTKKDKEYAISLFSENCRVESEYENDINKIKKSNDLNSFIENELRISGNGKIEIEDMTGMGKRAIVFWTIKKLKHRAMYFIEELNNKIVSLKKYAKIVELP